MIKGKKIYFASDVHLGLPNQEDSRKRERLFSKWLDSVKSDAEEIYLLGDIFDFWFEYKHVVPRGFTRTLGKISEITDLGIPVHFFTGNHDLWVYDYLPQETGMKVHKTHFITEFAGKTFLIGHGDGLNRKDYGFRILKSIFTSSTLQWLFARIHPNFAMFIAHKWSLNSRYSKDLVTPYLGSEKEEQVIYANELLKTRYFDYCIFGHRHLPLDITLENGKSRLINTGDWLTHFTYAQFDGNNIEVQYFQK